MATKHCTSYDVMPGEPQLGKQVECSIYLTLNEILEDALYMIIADGDIPSVLVLFDQNDEEIEVDFCTWKRDKTSKSIHIVSDYLTEKDYNDIGAALDEFEDMMALERVVRKILYRNTAPKQLSRTIEL